MAYQSQVKLLLPKFHRSRSRKYYKTALFGGGCWVSLTWRFHRHSAAGWAECAVAGPGRVRRQAVQFSERSSTPLIGHARVALSGVLTRLPSTQTDDAQRGGKGHKLLPAACNAVAHQKVSKRNCWEEMKCDGTRLCPGSGYSGMLSVVVISSLTATWSSLAPMGLDPGSTQTHGGAGTRAPIGPRAAAFHRTRCGGATAGGTGAVAFLPPLEIVKFIKKEFEVTQVTRIALGAPRTRGPIRRGAGKGQRSQGFEL